MTFTDEHDNDRNPRRTPSKYPRRPDSLSDPKGEKSDQPSLTTSSCTLSSGETIDEIEEEQTASNLTTLAASGCESLEQQENLTLVRRLSSYAFPRPRPRCVVALLRFSAHISVTYVVVSPTLLDSLDLTTLSGNNGEIPSNKIGDLSPESLTAPFLFPSTPTDLLSLPNRELKDLRRS